MCKRKFQLQLLSLVYRSNFHGCMLHTNQFILLVSFHYIYYVSAIQIVYVEFSFKFNLIFNFKESFLLEKVSHFFPLTFSCKRTIHTHLPSAKSYFKLNFPSCLKSEEEQTRKSYRLLFLNNKKKRKIETHSSVADNEKKSIAQEFM